MKNTLLIAAFALIKFSAFGQKIHFCDTSNKWTCFATAPELAPPNVFVFNHYYSDTITVHGTLYSVLNNGSILLGFVREDTTAKRVYAVVLPSHDSSEHVLYDFNLRIDDTFRYPGASVHYVAGIDSVIINTVWHKAWHLAPVSDSLLGFYNLDYWVIEGLGSVQLPLFPASPIYFEFGYFLTCFNNQGATPHLSHKVGMYFENDTSCSLTFGLGVNNNLVMNKAFAVVPNPINETSKIIFADNILAGSVVVLNGIGQVIANLPFQNKHEVVIGDKIKTPGLYFYQVTNNETGKTYSGKFISQ